MNKLSRALLGALALCAASSVEAAPLPEASAAMLSVGDAPASVQTVQYRPGLRPYYGRRRVFRHRRVVPRRFGRRPIYRGPVYRQGPIGRPGFAPPVVPFRRY